MYLNADDWFAPGVFSSVTDVMEHNNRVDIVGGDLFFHDEATKKNRRNCSEFRYPQVVMHYRYGFPYNPLSYFYRRKVQEEVGQFPVNEHYLMDYWFIIRALSRFRCGKLDEPFGYYRHTGYNKSSESPGSGLARVAQDYLASNGLKLKARYWAGLYFTEAKKGVRASVKRMLGKSDL